VETAPHRRRGSRRRTWRGLQGPEGNRRPTDRARASACAVVRRPIRIHSSATRDIATRDIATSNIATRDIATHDIATHDIATHDIATRNIATHD
jgi:hypothetical protein